MNQTIRQQDTLPAMKIVGQPPANQAPPNPPPAINPPPGLLAAPPRAVARPAGIRRWHVGLMLSFLLMVVLPSAAGLWYLENRAADQYASSVGFSIRKQDVTPTVDILGGLPGISTGGASDADILYRFIQSQKLVEQVNARLDLRRLFSKPENDPVFAFSGTGPIEDLLDYWHRMVKIFYDAGSGLIEVRVTAFTPKDAQDIARAIFAESSVMINRLSAIARSDTTRYARKDLDQAATRLKTARRKLTEFRNKTQIVDPRANIQGQMGVLNTLQQQLNEAFMKQELLAKTTRAKDPRLKRIGRQIAVIKARIAAERQKFGMGKGGSGTYSALVNTYERLNMDREFAERAYLAALTAFDTARAEAERQSRYLAAYIEPTLAQSAQYPQRSTLFGLIAGFLLLAWAILALIAYSIKDRR